MSPNVKNPSENEKHYTSSAGWYSLRYPSFWVVEEGTDCTTFLNPENGVGALQVSAYETPTWQNPKDVLIENLSDQQVPFDEKQLTSESHKGKSVASYKYTVGPWFKRLWFVSEDKRLLMITYNRKEEHQENEEQLIEKIVESLTIEKS